jgi:general secretion pathway protein D
LGGELPKPPSYVPSSPQTDQPADAAQAAALSGQFVVTSVQTKDALVTADPNTNTIIVVAPPAVQSVYKQLIMLLDKRRPQVMVEVTLVTLDTTNSFSLGVDLSAPDSRGRRFLFSSFGLSQVDVDTGQLALAPGTGFNGAILGASDINIVLRALATSGRAKVLSAPKVLVNDNSTATLNAVNEAPFVSLNASDTVSTTSFAGYASAGTSITMTPHISEGDHLQLRYSITLSSFTGQSSGGIPPPRQTNSVDSEVTVPDGCTIVVGGLTREDVNDTVSKVPWLGDIPLLGYIFSSRTKNNTQSTLFVFVRPVILRDDQFEDIKFYSRRDQDKAGVAQMPTSSPKWMR